MWPMKARNPVIIHYAEKYGFAISTICLTFNDGTVLKNK